jgi:hypothetical protein
MPLIDFLLRIIGEDCGYRFPSCHPRHRAQIKSLRPRSPSNNFPSNFHHGHPKQKSRPMVKFPFLERRKSDKSVLAKMVKDEAARKPKERPSGSRGPAHENTNSSKEKLTGSKNMMGKPKPIIPKIATGNSAIKINVRLTIVIKLTI